MTDKVTITNLEVENVKRVRAVAISPAANGLTLLGGKNRQGKTSVLDAICYALGGESYRPSELQNREGIATARMDITLSNGLRVTRAGKNAALKVTDPAGRKAGQTLLNSFIEELALNLPKFLNANDKDKAKTLLKILGIEEQLAALEQEERKLMDERLLAGRHIQHVVYNLKYKPQIVGVLGQHAPVAPLRPCCHRAQLRRRVD